MTTALPAEFHELTDAPRLPRPVWRISRRGNPWASMDGYHFVLMDTCTGWGIRVKDSSTGNVKVWPHQYPSLPEAKQASREILSRLLARRAATGQLRRPARTL